MDAGKFIDILGTEFFAGVPDSLLRPLSDCLTERYGFDATHHIIAANEGNCAALAAGYYLSTGKIPAVYMQNSGEGNIINPLASLLSEKVYGIPAVFIVGWRGEPGTHDEPQHVFQGEVTEKLLDVMNVASTVLDVDTTEIELQKTASAWPEIFARGQQAAIIVRKGALTYDKKFSHANEHSLSRETVIESIAAAAGGDPIVCTTGKAGRELFELRVKRGEGHEKDFLTVGSMGHCSSIAMGIALQKPEKRIWCIDGDGALIMHLGAMAVIGATKPANLVHLVINNEAHESVGGFPTAAAKINLPALATACGYEKVYSAESKDELGQMLRQITDGRNLTFGEIKCAIGSRADLGRPTTTCRENRMSFMEYLRNYKKNI